MAETEPPADPQAQPEVETAGSVGGHAEAEVKAAEVRLSLSQTVRPAVNPHLTVSQTVRPGRPSRPGLWLIMVW